jgi:hypothetical protein
MAGKIFVNYRREDSIGAAGRLHDRLAQAFGQKNIFMDVDQIPAGVDFVAHLNNEVAACEVILVVIGPHWLDVKDESGRRRLDNPDDFVTLEIAAALARNIRVIPVLLDGAGMPKASELPDSLKPLARRQAVELLHAHFGRDAEALVERVRGALAHEAAGPSPWHARAAIGAAAVAVLLIIGVGGYASVQHILEQDVQRKVVAAEEKRKSEEAEQQRLAALRAEEERRAKAAAEVEAKRRGDEAEQQRLAAIKAESSEQKLATPQIETSFTQRDVARVNAIASMHKLVLPPFEIKPPDPKLPNTLLKFVGIWASTVGFNGIGRHAMLIVTNVEAQDRAMGYFIWGPPNASTANKRPAGYRYFEGIIAGNELTFETQKYSMTVRFGTHDSLAMTQKNFSGETYVVSVIPVWRFAKDQ